MSVRFRKARPLSAWLLVLPLALVANSGFTESLRHVSAEDCAGCHAEIYQQWKKSMHANSTAMKDPIHGAFYRKVIGDPLAEGVRTKKGKFPVCLQCHVPAAAKDEKTKLDANPAYAEGINCVACHTLTKYKGVDWTPMRLGMQAYEYSDTHLQGSSGESYSNKPGGTTTNFHPYPMQGNQAMLRTTDACMGCHDKRNNAKGTPLCRTGDEIAETGFKGACLACHMPKVNGLADHSMLGGHSAEMVGSGLVMSMTAVKEDDELSTQVKLENVLPHGFPTGAPFRNVMVKVIAYDAAGKVVWQNYETNPIQEDKQAAFMLTLGDEAGKPTPPPTATQILSDTRLKPHEMRVLHYRIPSADVAMVRAEAFYNLLWPNLVKMLDEKGVLTPDLKEPKSVGVAEVRI